MKASALLLTLAALCFLLVPDSAQAEIVKRNMYTDSEGKVVQQYVFQAGNSRWSRPYRGVRYYGSGYRYGYGYYPYYRGIYPYRPAVHYRAHHRHGYHVFRGGGGVSGVISGGHAQIRVRF